MKLQSLGAAALFALGFACACGSDATARDTGDDVLDDAASGDVEPEAHDDGAADADADAGADADADGDPDAGDAEAEAEVPCGPPDPALIYEHIRELSSPSYAGRFPDTAGGEAALDYAEAVLASLDLEPAGDAGGFRQAFTYDQWRITAPPSLTVGTRAFELGTEFSILEYSGAGDVTGEVVFAGYGMTVPPFAAGTYPRCPIAETGYDDYAGLDVTGKIVLIFRHGPRDDETVPDGCPASPSCGGAACLWNFSQKAANARAHGAAAMLLVQDYREDPELPEGLTLEESGYDAGFPALVLERRATEAQFPELRTWSDTIDATLQPDSHATGVTATLSVATEIRTATTANLLGVVPGTDPTLAAQTVVLGAHIDHMGVDPILGEVMPGADDNASGTATTLELARSVVACGLAPARTLVFALFNAEEAGLIGSATYVDDPPYPLDQIAAMFSLDMVGAGDGTGLILYGTTESRLAWLADLMEGATAEAGLSYTVLRADPLDLSDHVYFYYAGVPAVFGFTIGDHDGYHTPADTIDHIRLEDLTASSAMMWATLVPLALGTEADYLGKRAFFRAAETPGPLPDLDRERHPIR